MSEAAWLNEPPDWSERDGILTVVTGERTDFWRTTHYGFVRDDGHLRHVPAPAAFTAELAFRGDYRALYDQAGLMLRADAETWIKCGIEHVGDRRMLSVVATRGSSDWSTAPLPPEAAEADWLRLRLTRDGDAVHVAWAADGPEPVFRMLRLAYFPPTAAAVVGPMCCSPQRAGFIASFRSFGLGAPMATSEA